MYLLEEEGNTLIFSAYWSKLFDFNTQEKEKKITQKHWFLFNIQEKFLEKEAINSTKNNTADIFNT